MSLNAPRTAHAAIVLVPVAFGLLSVLLGQDANWDLYNYHLYNAYAHLHGKLDVDLAPAGTQSYFNPALDIAYYYLMTRWWPPLAGFLLGSVHGLHFVLLYAIARRVLPDLPTQDRVRVPLLLALAGCLTANFLSGIGNSMGDNTTSLFQLGALLMLVFRCRRLHAWSPALGTLVAVAGVVSGLGVGLKVTNATYSLAMCLALLFVGGSTTDRMRLAFFFGCGTVAGIAITGGYWFAEMWSRFGNPLYPQFGNLFPSPLVRPIGALDTRWHPQSALEYLAWPFLISLDAGRVSEVRVRQIIWAVWYALFLAWLAVRYWPRRRSPSEAPLKPEAALIVVFVAAGFVIWAAVFSIYRYVVPMETLLPLAIWILLDRIFVYERARQYAKRVLSVCALVVLLVGSKTWGHVAWSDPPYSIDTPGMPHPDRTTVIVAEQPMAWLAIGFPPQVAFVSVLSSFPESPRYAERLRQILRERGGEVYVMALERQNWRVDSLARINRSLLTWRVLSSHGGCATLGWLLDHTRLHADLKWLVPGSEGDAHCELGLIPGDRKDLAAENRAALREVMRGIETYGLSLDADSCRTYAARYGDAKRPYRLCRVQ